MGRMPHGGRSEIGDVKTTLFFNEMRLVIAGIDGMVGVNLGQSVRKALRMHTFGHLAKDLK